MFERFTRDARTVVVSGIDLCTTLDADEVRPVHLLLALTEEGNGARDLLAAHGLTEDAVSAALGAPRPAPPAPLGDEDAAALRSLGIDLDAIREAVDKQFGEGALEGAAGPPADRGQVANTQEEAGPEPARARFALGGRVRFGRGAKKVLELSLREAIRAHSREIRSEHIALAVLRTDDDAVRMLLGTLGVDVRALRADLEGRGRRTA
ncbi:MAG TPA: Clp protease N-terminal domain-containing protein [Ornithinibacter sp.]|nr:Clp protease N-terminal domain-containing protein [Ornithinibacter sp.]